MAGRISTVRPCCVLKHVPNILTEVTCVSAEPLLETLRSYGMNCDKCGTSMREGDDRDYYGKVLCEDCYMDALSPTRSCDPWAVHSAKNLEIKGGATLEVNQTQQEILKVLKETGGLEPGLLSAQLNLTQTELERQLASLRHMEKVRAEMRDGRKVVTLW